MIEEILRDHPDRLVQNALALAIAGHLRAQAALRDGRNSSAQRWHEIREDAVLMVSDYAGLDRDQTRAGVIVLSRDPEIAALADLL